MILRVTMEYDLSRLSSEDQRRARGILGAGEKKRKVDSLNTVLRAKNMLSTEDDGAITGITASIIE